MTTTTDMLPVCCFGEILWDVLPEGPLPGGAPFNVAYHLSRLKVPCSLISRTGSDEDGEALKGLMEEWGVGSELLQTDPQTPTGRVIAEVGPENEMNYDILFPAAWDFIEAAAKATEKVKQAPYFIYGSLAARNAPSREALFSFLEQAPFKVLDINLRAPFFVKDTLEALLLKADLLKVNQSELEILGQLFGNPLPERITGPGGMTETEEAGFFSKQFDIPEIIVTKGSQGASFYTREGSWHAPGIPVTVGDTVGSGDSFLAAFIACHRQQQRPQVCLRQAVAMGSFIAGKKGGCPLYELSEYLGFLDKNTAIS